MDAKKKASRSKTANKTTATTQSVTAFLDSLEPEQKKACKTLNRMMKEITGEKAVMWGDAIVGFGQYHYKYASGREGDFFLTGFSPRKRNLTVYIMPGFKSFAALLKKLGKHKHSVSCLYFNKLEDIDLDVLREMIVESVEMMRKTYMTG